MTMAVEHSSMILLQLKDLGPKMAGSVLPVMTLVRKNNFTQLLRQHERCPWAAELHSEIEDPRN